MPPHFISIMENIYDGLAATIVTDDWITVVVPLQIGGDPLSVVIFNAVINSLVDTLKMRIDLGYCLHNSCHQKHLSECQQPSILSTSILLNITERWLEWAGMRAKVQKCHSLALQGSTGHTIDPKVTLSGQSIPFMGNKTINFLGLPITITSDPSRSRLT